MFVLSENSSAIVLSARVTDLVVDVVAAASSPARHANVPDTRDVTPSSPPSQITQTQGVPQSALQAGFLSSRFGGTWRCYRRIQKVVRFLLFERRKYGHVVWCNVFRINGKSR